MSPSGQTVAHSHVNLGLLRTLLHSAQRGSHLGQTRQWQLLLPSVNVPMSRRLVRGGDSTKREKRKGRTCSGERRGRLNVEIWSSVVWNNVANSVDGEADLRILSGVVTGQIKFVDWKFTATSRGLQQLEKRVVDCQKKAVGYSTLDEGD